jgi:hypothetical protein
VFRLKVTDEVSLGHFMFPDKIVGGTLDDEEGSLEGEERAKFYHL